MQIGNATAHVLTTGRSDRVSRNEVKTRKRPMAVPRMSRLYASIVVFCIVRYARRGHVKTLNFEPPETSD